MKHIIDVTNLKKNYGEIEAVRGIDFHVRQGELFAFLGPNGAGKSTTIDILCTLLKPDAGEVSVDGHPLTEGQTIRELLGIVFQDSLLDRLLTVRKNLSTRAKLYPKSGIRLKEAVRAAAQAAGAWDFIDRPYGKLSGGQKRRADIARALVHTPKILFLDEPTTGLDPQTKQNVWQTILGLQRREGMTVFLTTHYMEEAAASDYITIIDDGLIAAQGTPLFLKERYSSDTLRLKATDPQKLEQFLTEKQIPHTLNESNLITIPLGSTKDAIPILRVADPLLESFEVLHGTMEDVFLAVTGKEIREDA